MTSNRINTLVTVLPLVLGFALSACTPKPETVKPDATTTATTVTAQTVAPAPVATMPAPALAASVAQPLVVDPLIALQDPNSPISNRVVYFEFDRSEIQQSFLTQLDAHARFLVLNPQLKVRLEGHCDERGTREYNIGLGDRRSQSVRRLLMFQGVTAAQIVTVSYGEERPAADGHDEDGWSKNRRVELVYQR